MYFSMVETNNKAFHSLSGIPVHAILFAYMGEYFGKTVSAGSKDE